MKLTMHNGGTMELQDEIFACKPNNALMSQVVRADMSRSRVGKMHKTRAQVSGSGRKPWRQKGTGSARVGTRRNPIWRGGGVAFAATPDKRRIKVNRKMFRAALRSTLSGLCAENRLLVDEDIKLQSNKTREMAQWMKERELGKSGSALVVVVETDENIALASRNIPNLEVVEVAYLDVLTLLRFDKVLMTESTVRKLEERLA